MLAIPDEVKSCAKLRSPAADPSGTPSSRICVPEAPSSTPLPPLSSSALRSSFHVVSNCCEVFAWPNSYSRANFRRMFRLRTNARAPPRVSVPIRAGPQSCPSSAPFYRSEEHTSELQSRLHLVCRLLLEKKKKNKKLIHLI